MPMNRHGVVIVVSLGVLMLLSLLGASFLFRGIHEGGISDHAQAWQSSFSLAEASMDVVIDQLRTGAFGDVPPTSLSSGSYWAELADSTENASLQPLQYLITGHGLQGAVQRDLEALAALTPQSVFQFALFADQQLVVEGTVSTDSFDSSVAPYDPLNPGQQGDIGTNMTAAGGIVVEGNITVNGQMAVGAGVSDPTSVVVVNGGSYTVSAEPDVVAQSNNLQMPMVNPPPELSCTIPLSLNGGPPLSLPSGGGTACSGNACCFSIVSLGGSGTVTIDPGVDVTVYVTGPFSQTGNSTIGVVNDPTQLVMILTSPQQATIEGGWTGTPVFSGGLYAPTGSIDIGGNAQIFGSVISQNVEVSGNAEIHYDEALSSSGPTGSYQVQVLEWRDL